MGAEGQRLEAANAGQAAWRRWGPYLSERQWGTVREDYSANGDAWSFFSHDQARSRAYRWGEDGIAGVSDDEQLLCLAFALWNERDPILKERLFGLTNGEGNHGEDVKECYFYLDSTPTHSYMKMLYKYPQAAYPYLGLVEENRRRSRNEFEYELLDAGVFDEERYFDVVIEYAKASPEDVLVRATVANAGPEAATLHLLPTLWFRNTWSWGEDALRPRLAAGPRRAGASVVEATHATLGSRRLLCGGGPPLLFTENDTNSERLFGSPNASRYVKDGFDRYVVGGDAVAVNPAQEGTKAAAHYVLEVPSGGRASVRLRLRPPAPGAGADGEGDADLLGEGFDRVVEQRRAEADEFYREVSAAGLTDEERAVARQAFAGMLWSKQYYAFDVERWLGEHGTTPTAPKGMRDDEWFHMLCADVISMPDKWEYPWFAAWDLAFHAVVFSMIDIAFAKQQLSLLLTRTYQHPNGQVPAYEWNFGDVNPPVHAWAVYFVYELEATRTGVGDRAWLANMFHKLAKNFTWWVNRKDVTGRNVFQGGFLGLDNIGVFDRSAPLPTGGHLDQADGTAWMALYCQNMLQIALALAEEDPVYAEQAADFIEHFAWIALAVRERGSTGATMWDEQDGFFYDLLRPPEGGAIPLKVRSMVGLLPLAAATVIQPEVAARFPELVASIQQFIGRHPSLASLVRPGSLRNEKGAALLSLFGEQELRRILSKVLDEGEFLSPYGIRSLSRWHEERPYEFDVHGDRFEVGYRPAESDSGMFGGNSNWRGPIWFPLNALLIRALLNLYVFYGDGFTVECPTGSGRQMNLLDVAGEVARRLSSIFLPDAQGRRPVHGGQRRYQDEPRWRDLVLFYEYFHGDNGAGIGASHQTGWTGLVAVNMNLFAALPVAGERLLPGFRQAPQAVRR